METTNHEPRVMVKTKAQPKAASNAQAQVEASHGTMAAMAAVPTLIGLWALACLVGGLISSGGPLKLAYSWFLASSGL